MLISPRRSRSISACGAVSDTIGSITPVATMSITTAREALVLAMSAMPADSPRRLRLIA